MPIRKIISDIESNGGHCWDAIEPSDGFHPVKLFYLIFIFYIYMYF